MANKTKDDYLIYEAREIVQLVECLPCMNQALGPIINDTRKENLVYAEPCKQPRKRKILQGIKGQGTGISQNKRLKPMY